MMEIGESCKLCLKYVQGTNMAVLDETILGKLEFLQMDLDQSVEDSNSVCKECEERIEKAFDFKSCLVNTESCLVPYVCEDKTQKVNLKVVIEKDNSSMSIGETSTEKEVCRLCKNFVDAIAVISLPKILKDDNVTEVFQGHIPEMDLEVTENPVVCEKCQKSLASFSTLVASWSIANGMNEMEGDEDEDVKGEFEPNFEMVKVKNETIDDFSDSNTTSSTSMLEISDSAKTVKKTKKGKSATVKTEPDSSDIVSALNREIKTENGEEDESMEDDLQLKSEEVEIKDEDGLSRKTTKKVQKPIPTTVARFKCEECTFEANLKWRLAKHSLTHRTLSEVKTFNCPDCHFITKHEANLKVHTLTHKSFSEVKTFKCPECPFITKRKSDLRGHILTHKSLNEVETFKCADCGFLTKRKSHLKTHVLTHKSLNEINTFDCHECSFKARRKADLRVHVLTHKSLSEVPTFKCTECPYLTRRKSYLKVHILTHTRLSQASTFKCAECPFKTIYRSHLNTHLLTHKELNKVNTFLCTYCHYTTKFEAAMKRHVLKHRVNEQS